MRSSYLLPLLTMVVVALSSAGCDSAGDEGGTATITGRVIDATSGDPIVGARIEVPPTPQSAENEVVTTQTDSSGQYRLTVEIEEDTELSVRAINDESQAERTVTVFASQTRSGVNFELGTSTTPEEEPGSPSNILLENISRNTIGIVGSGAPEVTRVTYQVADSAGRPIDLDNETQVQFALGQQPGGGEFISPEQAETNNNGEVTVNLSSGTKAGTVQIVATAQTKSGTTIDSKPISVSIHGGLPVKSHFTLGPARFNFQGLVRSGLTNQISVILGDQYSNPVKPGTAVYFETTHGVIEGSVQTNEQGRGTVQLISAQPFPRDGVAVVTASTANSDEQRIEVKTPVLFSAAGILKVRSIPNRTFTPPLDLRQEEDVEQLIQALGTDFPFGGYDFIVTDRNGNPLPQGATIGFQAGGVEVGSAGDVSVELGDTEFVDQNGDGDALDYEDVVRGRGITTFSGSAVQNDNPDTAEQPDLESITFRMEGPQSSRVYTFTEPDTAQAGNQTVMFKDGEPAATLNNGRVTWEQ